MTFNLIFASHSGGMRNHASKLYFIEKKKNKNADDSRRLEVKNSREVSSDVCYTMCLAGSKVSEAATCELNKNGWGRRFREFGGEWLFEASKSGFALKSSERGICEYIILSARVFQSLVRIIYYILMLHLQIIL